MKNFLPLIAITIGDINGVGPEIIVKILAEGKIFNLCNPLIIGPLDILNYYTEHLKLPVSFQLIKQLDAIPIENNKVPVYDLWSVKSHQMEIGKPTNLSGKISGEALLRAVDWALEGKVHAIVTAPVSKYALSGAGFRYPGQTELIAERCQASDFVMVLLSGNFRVGLVTTHCPLAKVPSLISVEKIINKIKLLDLDLKTRFAITKPHIAVCALNPHGGEQGLLGTEEIEVIRPAIRAARELNIAVEGPFPADTLFARIAQQNFDAYLAMYHDQGLIALKMKAFGCAVNYSAGLPVIRTSPDHGTAYDIAGQGIADVSSMLEAIKLAARLAKKTYGS